MDPSRVMRRKHLTLKIFLFLVFIDLLETFAQFCFKKSALPAVGFAGGVERTVYKLKEKNLIFKKEDTNIVFLAQVSDSARLKAIVFFTELSKAGFQVLQAFTIDNLKDQLEEAKRVNAKIIL